MIKTRFLSLVAVFLTALLAVQAPAAGDLHEPWTVLLERHVHEGMVDYQGFKASEKVLDRYLAYLNSTQPEELAAADQLAFYINGYNAYTVKLILNHFSEGRPVASIRDIGGWFTSPWEIDFVRLGGKTLTLDTVEHDIIRPRFEEPRIHFAVNCASKSCPPLRNTAYEGDLLDAQLEKSTRDFLMDSRHNYLEDDILYVSSIFKWYGEDFENGVAAFFLAHTDGDLRQRLEEAGDKLRIRYLDYDWSLNGLPNDESSN